MDSDINVNLSKDALGLSKPLTKFVETIGQGAGVVGNAVFQFDAKKIKRISRAEADAERLKIINRAEAEGEALLILGRASQRFQLEQYNKQVNLENTLAKTKNILEKEHPLVSDQPVDNDWSTRFLSVAQDISDDEIQSILASIFASEITTPGTNSKRLLELLKSIDRNELDLFTRFSALSSDIGMYAPNGFSNSGLQPYGFSVNDIRSLADIGLVTFDRQLSVTVDIVAGTPQFLAYHKQTIAIVSETNTVVELPLIPLSKTGEQLHKYATPYTKDINVDSYFTSLIKYLKDIGLLAVLQKI